ncbi:hypothetical protein CMUST_14165 [Corynebacterium mustelae]|uniref:Uncharacterized protein n=1 Tax=Corynebacterium mustelae TaxID=571915 RepID=A0A0G3H177_9CORY|nr:hypothetical protein [Corynebacterium mustelae]AKK07126.1 hypothetical protein CMUST_14165 [Corynebacterium mustelae]
MAGGSPVGSIVTGAVGIIIDDAIGGIAGSENGEPSERNTSR